MLRIDPRLGCEERDSAPDVAHRIGDGGLVDIPARSTRSSIVDSQYGDIPPRQVIGQHQEEAMAKNAVVTILRSRAIQKEDC